MGSFRGGRGGGSGGNSKVGEIVEVEGGHIVRSTGRKDRHSKVCTAKGPRDRRVRLSAHTAIQFYDVQDRLGYDRPSKAVDWLIKKAKPAIDELAQLPAWQPTAEPRHRNRRAKSEIATEPDWSSSSLRKQPLPPPPPPPVESPPPAALENLNPVSLLPPPLYSDTIADTIKSFFPQSSYTASSSSSSFANFHHYHEQPPALTRELRLSLQSFPGQHSGQNQHHPALQKFPGEDAGGNLPQEMFLPQDWDQQQQQAEMGRLQRFVSWNAMAADGGFLSSLPPQFLPPMPMPVGHAAAGLFIQRGPLQSSHSPSVRARILPETQTSIPMGLDGLVGFRIPARIQGEEEQEDDYNKSSSAPSASHR